MPPDRKGTIDVGTAINSPLTITNITVNGTVLSAAEVQRREQHYLRRVIKDWIWEPELNPMCLICWWAILGACDK